MTDCPLTEKELAVVKWLADGKTNEEIGIILGMTPRTVARRIEAADRASDTFNRTQLACKALRKGWIS